MNLSEHVAHVTSVLVVAHAEEHSVVRRLSSSPGVLPGDDAEADGVAAYREGSLQPGATLSLGTFAQLVDDLAPLLVAPNQREDDPYTVVEAVEVRVVTDDPRAHEEDPVGAARRYALEHDADGHVLVHPADRTTRQMRSSRERAEVRRWLEETLEPDTMTGRSIEVAGHRRDGRRSAGATHRSRSATDG